MSSYPATLLLAGWALVVGVLSGLALGFGLSLLDRGRGRRGTDLVPLLAQAMPGFVVAILAVQLFSVRWQIFPPSGFDEWSALVLPGTLLGLGVGARLGLLLHDRLQTLPNEPFVLFARAKGLSESRVYSRHMFRPALSLVLAYSTLQFGYLLGGALVVETVFAYPGVGQLAVTALSTRDLPVLQACVFVSALSFLAMRFVADMVHYRLDPRLADFQRS